MARFAPIHPPKRNWQECVQCKGTACVFLIVNFSIIGNNALCNMYVSHCIRYIVRAQ